MAAISFDTLEIVTRLKEAGVADAHAEAIVKSFRDIHASADLATKADIEVRLAELKAELVKWVVTVGVLQTSIIAALVLKLVH